MPKIEKLAIPLFLNEEGDPVGFIYFHPVTHKRVIFVAHEASEEEMVELYEKKDIKV